MAHGQRGFVLLVSSFRSVTAGGSRTKSSPSSSTSSLLLFTHHASSRIVASAVFFLPLAISMVGWETWPPALYCLQDHRGLGRQPWTSGPCCLYCLEGQMMARRKWWMVWAGYMLGRAQGKEEWQCERGGEGRERLCVAWRTCWTLRLLQWYAGRARLPAAMLLPPLLD